MKRSTAVVLVLSGAMGAMFQGCSEKPSPSAQGSWGDSGLTTENTLTNNTYVEGRGYYHAPHYAFFPFPYNHYVAGQGFYRGGQYSPQPDNNVVAPTKPGRYYQGGTAVTPSPSSRATTRGGFTSSRGGFSGRS